MPNYDAAVIRILRKNSSSADRTTGVPTLARLERAKYIARVGGVHVEKCGIHMTYQNETYTLHVSERDLPVNAVDDFCWKAEIPTRGIRFVDASGVEVDVNSLKWQKSVIGSTAPSCRAISCFPQKLPLSPRGTERFEVATPEFDVNTAYGSRNLRGTPPRRGQEPPPFGTAAFCG